MSRILIVDDESSIRIALRELLADADYEVSVAEDADKALGLLAEEDYDVVVSDIILPRMTGVDLLKAIKQASTHVQVIMMTGEPTVETASEAMRKGACDYLAKPIGKEQLLKAVANAVRIKTLDDERRRLAEENRRHREDLETLVGERTAQLEAQNAQLERFTYTVSHDLKSPLVTIKGFLGLLERDALAGETARMRHDLQRIAAAVDTMGSLLDDLIALSSVGWLQNPPEATPLSDLAQEAVVMVERKSEIDDIEIEIDPRMPVIHGDRVRLLEVFVNLIENAFHFLGGQAKPKIEVGARLEDTEVSCWVGDNGMGIDPAYQEKIFDLFERLDASEPGTGVGLALVKRIVEVHGGRTWVESEGIGQGSVFRFTLAL